jgi:hypothetical protein
MSFCTSCGKGLKPGASFCTHCGAKAKPSKTKAPKKHEIVNEGSEKVKRKKSILPKLYLLFLICAVAYWGYKQMNTDDNLSNQVGSSLNISGEYFEPSGVLLGSPDNTITISKKGNKYEGKNEDGSLTMKFLPMGSNNYSVEIIKNRAPSDFEVHYYENEGKLTFFNSITKNSWYLTKLPDTKMK